MSTSILVGTILLAGAVVDVAVIALLVAPRAKTAQQKMIVFAAGAACALVMAGIGVAFLVGAFSPQWGA